MYQPVRMVLYLSSTIPASFFTFLLCVIRLFVFLSHCVLLFSVLMTALLHTSTYLAQASLLLCLVSTTGLLRSAHIFDLFRINEAGQVLAIFLSIFCQPGSRVL
jgi:hypothetical protein